MSTIMIATSPHAVSVLAEKLDEQVLFRDFAEGQGARMCSS
jgi:hypothetical protein